MLSLFILKNLLKVINKLTELLVIDLIADNYNYFMILFDISRLVHQIRQMYYFTIRISFNGQVLNQGQPIVE